MGNNLIRIFIKENKEQKLYESTTEYDYVIGEENKTKIENFVIKNILEKLPTELMSIHVEKEISVFEIKLNEKGIYLYSFYLGFLENDKKDILEGLIKDVIKSLEKNYNEFKKNHNEIKEENPEREKGENLDEI